MKNKFLKIRYHENETGWVEKLDSKSYRVSNIPIFATNINLDDIVTIGKKQEDGFKCVDNIEEIKLYVKALFSYSEIGDLRRIVKQYEQETFQVEGIFRPKCNDKGEYMRGIANVACNLTKKELNKILKQFDAKIVSYIRRKPV